MPSFPPDVQLIPIGDNKVLVLWTPLFHATVYVVTYSTFLTSRIVVVDNGSANNAILEDISVGVDHSVTVQANGDIPGLVSNAVSITLTGEYVSDATVRMCMFSLCYSSAREVNKCTFLH